MSGTTQELGRQIAGAQDLQSVVRSMKALAASSISQYELAVASLEVYYRTVKLGISACLRDATHLSAPVAEPLEPKRSVGTIVFGSDQGLVGGFNQVIVDFVAETVKALPLQVSKSWAIGERAQALLLEAGLTSVKVLPVPSSVDAITSLVSQILIDVEMAREGGEIWEVYVFHNRPKQGSLYDPVCKKLLPLDRLWQDKLQSMPWPSHMLPEVIDGVDSTMAALVRGYLFVVLFQACAESLASENASRLAAMQRAETNIEDILDQLSRSLHRIRQESIDEELFDVISGFEAFNQQGKHDLPFSGTERPHL